jgi:hypothetical protein
VPFIELALIGGSVKTDCRTHTRPLAVTRPALEEFLLALAPVWDIGRHARDGASSGNSPDPSRIRLPSAPLSTP